MSCSHTFAWWGVVPPSRCPGCGQCLHPAHTRPYHPGYPGYPYPQRPWGPYYGNTSGHITITSSNSTAHL